MTYKTHLALSLTATLPVMSLTGTLSGGGIAALALGTLLPDIDEPGSWIGRRTRGISDMMNRTFGHRGMTHSLVAVGVVVLLMVSLVLLLNVPAAVAAAFIGGYSLHLMGDSFSKSGIAWLQPFKNKKFQSGFGVVYYTTGSMVEKLLLVGLVAVLVYIVSRMELSLSLADIYRLPGEIWYSFGQAVGRLLD